MPLENELAYLVKKVNPELNFFSSLMNCNRDSIKPLFMYHVPKTGGMSFQTSIEWAQINLGVALKNQGINQKIPAIGRAASLDDLKALNHGFFYLLTTHLPYGAHLLPEVVDFELMCIFRDPIERIRSAYTYQCMRQNKIPSEQGFVEFFRDEENRNRFCKQLHPNALEETTVDHKAVIQNLDDNFSTVVTTNELQEATEYYLSLFNLPNVLQGKVNHTMPQFLLDVDKYKDEISELNIDDLNLYNHVKDNIKIPELKDVHTDDLNRVTSMIFGSQTTEKYLARGVPIPTQAFLSNLKKLTSQSLTSFDLMLMNYTKIIGKHDGING